MDANETAFVLRKRDERNQIWYALAHLRNEKIQRIEWVHCPSAATVWTYRVWELRLAAYRAPARRREQKADVRDVRIVAKSQAVLEWVKPPKKASPIPVLTI